MYTIKHITKKTEIKNTIANMLLIITAPLKFDSTIISQKGKLKTIYMIATLTNKTENEIEEMGLKDFMALQKGLSDFFSTSRGYSLEAIALVGHTLHFGYCEILDMSLGEFWEFVRISKEILKVGAF